MNISIKDTSLKPLAEKLVNRLTAMGVVTKTGRTLVIDHGYELVAALAGYRNQHALRAALKQTAASAAAPSAGQTESPELLNEQIEVLRRLGYSVVRSDFGNWYWVLGNEASEDFFTVPEAWRDAWQHEAFKLCAANSLLAQGWPATNLEAQLQLMKDWANAPLKAMERELEETWGEEHPHYVRADWLYEMQNRYTNLHNYWAWVAHRVDAAGGPEEHCTCGAPLDDGKGYDGLCGDCADKAAASPKS